MRFRCGDGRRCSSSSSGGGGIGFEAGHQNHAAGSDQNRRDQLTEWEPFRGRPVVGGENRHQKDERVDGGRSREDQRRYGQRSGGPQAVDRQDDTQVTADAEQPRDEGFHTAVHRKLLADRRTAQKQHIDSQSHHGNQEVTFADMRERSQALAQLVLAFHRHATGMDQSDVKPPTEDRPGGCDFPGLVRLR